MLDIKQPNPKNQPYKNFLFSFNDNFFLKIKIKKKLKVIKLIIIKLYGGKLKEVKPPKITKYKYSK